MEEEVCSIRTKKMRLAGVADSLSKEAEIIADKAASSASVLLFSKAHSMTKQAKAMRGQVAELEKELETKLSSLM